MTRRRHGLACGFAIGVLLALSPASGADKATSPAKPDTRLKAVEHSIDQKRAEHEEAHRQAEALAGELDALRKESVAAAAAARLHERTIAGIEAALARLHRDAAQKEHALDGNRASETALLGALERLALEPPEALAAAPDGPVDRLRGGMLLAAAVPALGAEARALSGEIDALATAKAAIAAKHADLVLQRRTLDQNREVIGQMVARKIVLQRLAAQDELATAADLEKLSGQASDLRDLIARLDADRDRRDKALAPPPPKKSAKTKVETRVEAAAADPLRPKELRSFDAAQGALLLPVSGHVVRRYGEADAAGVPSKGLTLAAPGGAEVVAPFDGRVEFAGQFHGYGLILIIRHGDGYHSLLAGLGRIDARVGQWVLAGEPVGTTPAGTDKTTDETGTGSTLYLELRHDGRPVDPQPWLAEGGAEAGSK